MNKTVKKEKPDLTTSERDISPIKRGAGSNKSVRDISPIKRGAGSNKSVRDKTELNKVKNKGTGAGGHKTNKNGLPYEKITELKDYITLLEENKFYKKINFKKNDIVFINVKKGQLFKYMEKHIDKTVKKGHGCKKPDECYIDEKQKKIFLIEKKFQQCPGSVCEKIQTPDFKIWQYNRTFPEFKIIYIYCLSDWFKKNCEAELEYLKYKKIPFFWGNNKTYKIDIINFIINYK